MSEGLTVGELIGLLDGLFVDGWKVGSDVGDIVGDLDEVGLKLKLGGCDSANDGKNEGRSIGV